MIQINTMAEDRSFTIERSLEGDIIYFIARNNAGVIIAHELTLEKLQDAIKSYKEPPPPKEEEQDVKPKEKKFLTNKLTEEVQERKKEQETEESKHLPGVKAHLEGEIDEEPKKLLENELKTKVQERKEQSKKKSFWDKLR